MSGYLFELPTTGAVSFSDYTYDQTASYIADVSDTTEARANLRAVLKESKRTDEKDFLKLVKVLDDYIPKLYSIFGCTKEGELILTSEPIFSWRTTLSSAVFNSSPRLSFPSIAAELAFTLLTYGFALSNYARAAVAVVGNYEAERGISDSDRRVKDEKIGFAVTLLCKSAGVFEFVAKEVMFEWDAAKSRANGLGMSCPNVPELSREVLIGLSKMALADAQNIAIRKLLTRAVFDSVVTPGPPLPKSHPSPALAAKLHLECAALYRSARALINTPGSSRPNTSSLSSKSKFKFGLGNKDRDIAISTGREEQGEEVIPELKRYLSDEIALHDALAHKWLGVDNGENGGQQQSGIAVGFLTWSKKELEDLRSGSLGGGVGIVTDREKDMRETRKARVQKELESVNVFLQGYKRMNDSMSFQSVPAQSDLQATIPAGRMAVSLRPYTKPTPAFGPGSVEYTRNHEEELRSTTNEADSTDFSRSQVQDTYAGAGSYF